MSRVMKTEQNVSQMLATSPETRQMGLVHELESVQ